MVLSSEGIEYPSPAPSHHGRRPVAAEVRVPRNKDSALWGRDNLEPGLSAKWIGWVPRVGRGFGRPTRAAVLLRNRSPVISPHDSVLKAEPNRGTHRSGTF